MCRKNYTQAGNIGAAVNRLEHPSTSRTTRGPTFDFINKCFLCGEDASKAFIARESKKPISKREFVSEVRTLTFKPKIEEIAEERKDDWGGQILDRLQNVIDLVAAEGRYHRSCLRNFHKQPSENPIGRPVDPEITGVIEFISNYIEENNQECQFSLSDITRAYQGQLPSEATIKQKLKDKSGEEICITANNKKAPIICFRNIGFIVHRLLCNLRRSSNV